jgi:CheY-like chemotaxis protein
MKTLWIEDKNDQIKYHLSKVRSEGHEVVVAETGEEAIDYLFPSGDSKGSFQLLILDIMLPKGSGQRVEATVKPESMGVEILHRLGGSSVSIPVIVLSAIVDETARREITEYSFVKNVIKKPVKTQELLDAIAAATKVA